MSWLSKLSTVFPFLFSSCMTVTAQQTTFKVEFLKKWETTTKYTIDVAEKMPSNLYNFKPADGMRTFGEQMEHIGYAITYLPKKALGIEEIKYKDSLTDKKALIAYLKGQSEIIKIAVEQTDETKFEEKAYFWAGKMSLRKVLNVVYDHTTHNRAQSIFYLRINGLKAPQYKVW